MSSDIFTVKIERMKQTDIDSIIAIEEKAYGEHHWSRESFFNELSNELARYYSAFDENGKEFTIRVREDMAVAFQHELDHLDGILFVDKIDKKNPYKNSDIMREI